MLELNSINSFKFRLCRFAKTELTKWLICFQFEPRSCSFISLPSLLLYIPSCEVLFFNCFYWESSLSELESSRLRDEISSRRLIGMQLRTKRTSSAETLPSQSKSKILKASSIFSSSVELQIYIIVLRNFSGMTRESYLLPLPIRAKNLSLRIPGRLTNSTNVTLSI